MTIIERLTEGDVSKLEMKAFLRRATVEELEELAGNDFFYEESIQASEELSRRIDAAETERLDALVTRVRSGEITLEEAVLQERDAKYVEPLLYAAGTDKLQVLVQYFLNVAELAAFIIDRRANPPAASGEE